MSAAGGGGAGGGGGVLLGHAQAMKMVSDVTKAVDFVEFKARQGIMRPHGPALTHARARTRRRASARWRTPRSALCPPMASGPWTETRAHSQLCAPSSAPW